MIFINAPLEQDKMIETLESYNENGVTFKLEKKAGMKLTFSTNMEDLDAAAKLAKSTIKAQRWASVLYFQVGVEK
ncbi:MULTISPECIES: hypothetical protein [Lacticaseibacillus]|uniref:HMA domain-containing protein n=3 Tax=Lacticaseibacillus TaxID=2759736 RepID=A0ABW4CHU2_9LACO|nr:MULTISPECIES: hypothetical protein [Lacticaseibacillus]